MIFRPIEIEPLAKRILSGARRLTGAGCNRPAARPASPLLVLCALLGVLLAGCKTPVERIPPATPPAVQSERLEFYPAKLAAIDQTFAENIAKKMLPGGVLWLEHRGNVYHKAYGNRAVEPAEEAMTTDTVFDSASLTKVLATTPAVMILIERGRIDLDAPAARYLPEFGAKGKDKITVRHLLTHSSGLRPGIWLEAGPRGYERAIEIACAEKPMNPPGEVFRYSDINFEVLGEIVRRVSGQPLDQFAREQIFAPLGMTETGYLPDPALQPRTAPTEPGEAGMLRGVVHDPTARKMGGVAGHAGVFTTARDLARYCRMLLNEGELDGVRILRPETVRLMTSVQSPPEVTARRGLGWDIDSPYAGPRGKLFPLGSYGHTGWTGTSVWIDPFSQTFVIILSNRNHPDGGGDTRRLRSQVATLAAEAIPDFNFSSVPGALEAREEAPAPATVKTAKVLNGIDVLKARNFAEVKNLRLGLITNHTGVDRERNPTIDLLHNAPGVQLVALFSPEHGIRGLLDEKVGDSTDERTGKPVYSLYGERRTPSPEQLATIDALVFDIQDIGARFYTYISTMGNCMDAAAKAGKKFFVLDRVNPINGTQAEGPILDGEPSFTGWHTIPIRHGMTVGELARMFNEERQIGAELTVVPVEGWERPMLFDQTGLPWVNPSPNMRSLAQALLYPGIGILETTSLSVGRGTDTPFEVIGAPYIDDLRLSWELNEMSLPGVRFIPVAFTPKASVFSGKLCRGVNIVVTDREAFRPVRTGIAIASRLQALYPEDFGIAKLNRLLVHPGTVEGVRTGQALAEIEKSWEPGLKEFAARREKYLIYR